MSPDELQNVDKPLADLLAALDANLAAGTTAAFHEEPSLPPDQLRLFRLARDSLLHLEHTWPRTAPGAGQTTEAASVDLLSGTGRFGKFHIKRELGRGSGGIVFLATDTTRNIDVALKLPRFEVLLDAELRQRFLQEARVTVGLEHPCLVEVCETGEIGAVCYIASTYVSETTLASWMETRLDPVPVRTAAAVVAALARGVDYLHEHQILHRDIKPSNVLLNPIASATIPDPDLAAVGMPCLTDFGLAKLLDVVPQATLQSGLTGGAILGTAEYMAPEQVDGRPELLGRPVDIFALGAVLYELIAGQTPFRGRNKFDTLRKVLANDPIAPRRLRKGVPRDLESICLKCLEKDPRRRYATAGQLSEDLQRFLAGQRTAAQAIPWWIRTWRWSQKRPSATLLFLLVMLSPFCLAFAVYSFEWNTKKARAEGLSSALFNAEPDNVSHLVRSVREYRSFVAHELRSNVGNESAKPDKRLRAALVLCPHDDSAVRYLRHRSLDANPVELRLICEALAEIKQECVPHWTEILNDRTAGSGRRLRAACALAQLAPELDLWTGVGSDIAGYLVEESPVAGWTQLIAPVKSALLPWLKIRYADPASPTASRSLAAIHLAEFSADDLPALVGYLRTADDQQFHYFFAKLRENANAAIPSLQMALNEPLPPEADDATKDRFARIHANVALALLKLEVPKPALDGIRANPDPRLRSNLIHSMKACQIDPTGLARELRATPDDTVRYALLLALGDYSPETLAKRVRNELIEEVERLYRSHPHSGVHSAAGWLLDRWNAAQPRLNLPFAKARAIGLNWYSTTEGQTLAIVIPAGEAMVPPPPAIIPLNRKALETSMLPVKVSPFAIATCEVTVEQFRRFATDQLAKNNISEQHLPNLMPEILGKSTTSPDLHCPINDVSFMHAALYCNWLSEREGIPPSQWCYRITVGKQAREMELHSAEQTLTGYRLPSEAEWEFACRAGVKTSMFFGEGPEHLSKYGWYYSSSQGRTWPVGRLRPNPLGLFDMYGNVGEWCIRSWGDVYQRNEILRGGTWRFSAADFPLNNRLQNDRTYFNNVVGFRVARTIERAAVAGQTGKPDPTVPQQ